jgi:hypothetical protein
LTFEQTNTGTIGNPDGDPATGLAARVSYVGDANVSTFVFENAIGGLLTPDDFVDLETTANGAVNLSGVLSIPVLPDDQFYVIASSAATAGGAGAFAESLSTLTTSFDPADAANLEAAGQPAGVPALGSPAAGYLVFILGSIGIFLGPRRRPRGHIRQPAPRSPSDRHPTEIREKGAGSILPKGPRPSATAHPSCRAIAIRRSCRQRASSSRDRAVLRG